MPCRRMRSPLWHPDALRRGIVEVGEFAHAGGEVLRCAALDDLHFAPVAIGIEECEQIGRPSGPHAESVRRLGEEQSVAQNLSRVAPTE